MVDAKRVVGSDTAGAVRTAASTVCERRASSVAGVPARFAQPCRAGPASNQMPIASGTTSAAVAPAARKGAAPSVTNQARASTEPTTTATATSPATSMKPARASLPVPSAWTSATGQQAYASQ